MIRARAFLPVLALLVPAAVQSQASTSVRSGAYFESYSFGDGLAFTKISELTIPFVVTQHFGSRIALDISSAFASASVTEAGGSSIDYSGLVDTDVRATVSVVPGRLILNLVGTLPTGATEVADTTIPLFGATATDLLGFSTPGFGSGGGFSAGFASAFKMGSDWAVGTGASYRYGASYTPVKGGNALVPGGEIRARLGVEGPFGGGKYFRGALIFTTTAANDIGGGQESAIGNRILGYAALSMPMGRSNLALYVWDMKRMQASNADAPSTIAVPTGNVLALGVRLDRPLNPKATLSPLVEFRHELTGAAGTTELLGYLVRAGSDFRYRLSDHATGVIQAQVAFGTLQDEGTSVSLFGPRLGALIEWSR